MVHHRTIVTRPTQGIQVTLTKNTLAVDHFSQHGITITMSLELALKSTY